jgi:hypothetical protein
MKHLFIGGPRDGEVHDLEAEYGITHERRRSGVITPNPHHPGASASDPAVTVYYPRRYVWPTERGGVEIEVMASSVSEPLAGRLLLHLFRLAGLDVTWQPDSNEAAAKT